MQSLGNAGVIVYKDSRLPQLLSVFSTPRLEESIAFTEGEEEHTIFILYCPVSSDRLDNRRYKLLRELVDENKIKFLVERFETKVQSNVSKRKNETHYSDLMPEIRAMKQLAVLLKKSQDCGENLLKGNVGFIMGEPDKHKIDLLSEESCNVMLYEGPALTEQIKWKLHHELMEKKGVSLIFTKEIERIISESDILSIDEKIDLYPYIKQLSNKIVLGEGNHEDINSINNIALWHKDLAKEPSFETLLNLNDEILSIIRYFYIKLDIIDFIKKLPYIFIK